MRYVNHTEVSRTSELLPLPVALPLSQLVGVPETYSRAVFLVVEHALRYTVALGLARLRAEGRRVDASVRASLADHLIRPSFGRRWQTIDLLERIAPGCTGWPRDQRLESASGAVARFGPRQHGRGAPSVATLVDVLIRVRNDIAHHRREPFGPEEGDIHTAVVDLLHVNPLLATHHLVRVERVRAPRSDRRIITAQSLRGPYAAPFSRGAEFEVTPRPWLAEGVCALLDRARADLALPLDPLVRSDGRRVWVLDAWDAKRVRLFLIHHDADGTRREEATDAFWSRWLGGASDDATVEEDDTGTLRDLPPRVGATGPPATSPVARSDAENVALAPVVFAASQQAFATRPAPPQQAFAPSPAPPQQAFATRPAPPQQAFAPSPAPPQQAFAPSPAPPQQAFAARPTPFAPPFATTAASSPSPRAVSGATHTDDEVSTPAFLTTANRRWSPWKRLLAMAAVTSLLASCVVALVAAVAVRSQVDASGDPPGRPYTPIRAPLADPFTPMRTAPSWVSLPGLPGVLVKRTEVTVGEFATCVSAGLCRWSWVVPERVPASMRMLCATEADRVRARDEPLRCVLPVYGDDICDGIARLDGRARGRMPTDIEWTRLADWRTVPPRHVLEAAAAGKVNLCDSSYMEWRGEFDVRWCTTDKAHPRDGHAFFAPVGAMDGDRTPAGLVDVYGNAGEIVRRSDGGFSVMGRSFRTALGPFERPVLQSDLRPDESGAQYGLRCVAER
jgi:hypothetical protein